MTRPELVVTADDYGLTDGTCRAILSAHARGVVTATSVLVVAPGAVERMRWLSEAPELSVGVHLAMVGEDPPILSAAEVPTLVDRRGRMRLGWRTLVPLLAARRVDPNDVRREFQAQIDLVAAVRAPTHLDSHQHLHLWPMVGDLVVELASSNGIGAVRVPRPTSRTPRNLLIDRLSRHLAATVSAGGASSTDRFLGLDEAGSWTTDRLVAALAVLDPAAGSVELNLHPGASADPERDRYGWDYRWGSELEAVLAPSVRIAIDAAGFELAAR